MANKKNVTRSAGGRSVPVHGELRSGPIAGTALIDGVTFAQKPVLYAEVEGQAIFEGDIVLGAVQDIQQEQTQGLAPRSIGITGAQFRWPNAQVPYEIDSALPNQQRVTDAIAHWEAHTRIRFVKRTAANQGAVPRLRALYFGQWMLVDGWPSRRSAKCHAGLWLQRGKRYP